MKYFLFNDQPFQQCHASTIEIIFNDNVVVAWFAGTKEGHSDVAIWITQLRNNEWRKPFIIAKDENSAHWNPVLSWQKNKLLLYYKVGKNVHDWESKKLTLDAHLNIINKETLPSQETKFGKITKGPVRGKPIELSKDLYLEPSSVEKLVTYPKFNTPWYSKWQSLFHKNDKTIFINSLQTKESEGLIQPSPWKIDNERVSAFFRSSEGCLFRSNSFDNGDSWSDAIKTALPNPNSAVDVVSFGKNLAMVWNPVKGNWAKRTPLIVSFSDLEGNLWKNHFYLEQGEGSFAYPAIVYKDDALFISYTWNRRNIVVTKLNLTFDLKGLVKEVKQRSLAPVFKDW